MRELFSMDTKDYNPNGKVFSRPSARGIIEQEGKILLMYSRKYKYYKFPGGGIEKDEKPEQALIREVQEESGYIVLADTIEEFGRVLRRQRDSMDENGIFEQENLYYICKIAKEQGKVCLDDYEAEEGFTPVWKCPAEAAQENRYSTCVEDKDMVDRETKVLEMVDRELDSREKEVGQ